MANNDNALKRIYDEMSKSYNMGSFDTFRAGMDNESVRKRVYDTMSQSYNMGSYDDFTGGLGYGQTPPAPAAHKAEEVNPDTTVEPSVEIPEMPMNTTAAPAAEQDSAAQPVQQAQAYSELTDEQLAGLRKETDRERRRLQRQAWQDASNFADEMTDEDKAELAKLHGYEKYTSPILAKYADRQPSPEQTETIARSRALEVEQTRRDQDKRLAYRQSSDFEVAALSDAELDRQMQALRDEKATDDAADKASLDGQTAYERQANPAAYGYSTFNNKKEKKALLERYETEKSRRNMNTVNEALRPMAERNLQMREELYARTKGEAYSHEDSMLKYYLDQADKTMMAASKYDPEQSNVKDWWNGFTNGIADVDTWSLDLSAIARAKEIQRIAVKLGEGYRPTDAEENILEAYYNSLGIEQLRQGDLSSAYLGGLSGAQSLAFMVQIGLTAGVGSLARRGLTKFVANRFGEDAAKKLVQWIGTQTVTDAAGRKVTYEVAKNAAGKASRKFYKAAADEYARNWAATLMSPTTWANLEDATTEQLLAKAAGQDAEELTALDKYRIMTNQRWELETESKIGEGIDAALGRVLGGNSIFGKWSRRMGSVLGRYMQSPVAEMSEEYVNAVASIIRSYNPLYKEESNRQLRDEGKELFSGSGLAQTAYAIVPQTLVTAGLGSANVGIKTFRYDKSRKALETLLRGNGATDENIGDIMAAIERSGADGDFLDRMDRLESGLLSGYLLGEGATASSEEAEKAEKNIRAVVNDYIEAAIGYNSVVDDIDRAFKNLSKEDQKKVRQELYEYTRDLSLQDQIIEEYANGIGTSVAGVKAKLDRRDAATINAVQDRQTIDFERRRAEAMGGNAPLREYRLTREKAEQYFGRDELEAHIGDQLEYLATLDNPIERNLARGYYAARAGEQAYEDAAGQRVDEQMKVAEEYAKSVDNAGNVVTAQFNGEIVNVLNEENGVSVVQMPDGGRQTLATEQLGDIFSVPVADYLSNHRAALEAEAQAAREELAGRATEAERNMAVGSLEQGQSLTLNIAGNAVSAEVQSVGPDGVTLQFEQPVTLPNGKTLRVAQFGGKELADMMSTNEITRVVDEAIAREGAKNKEEADKAKAEMEANAAVVDEIVKATGFSEEVIVLRDMREAAAHGISPQEYMQSNASFRRVNGKDVIYLIGQNALAGRTADEARGTIMHELIAHKGVRLLKGDQFNATMNEVWKGMTRTDREKFIRYALLSASLKGAKGKDYEGFQGKNSFEQNDLIKKYLNDENMILEAADEYVANIAEKLNLNQELTPEEKDVWDRIVEAISAMLDKVLGRQSRTAAEGLSRADIEQMLRDSYASMKSTAEAPATTGTEASATTGTEAPAAGQEVQAPAAETPAAPETKPLTRRERLEAEYGEGAGSKAQKTVEGIDGKIAEQRKLIAGLQEKYDNLPDPDEADAKEVKAHAAAKKALGDAKAELDRLMARRKEYADALDEINAVKTEAPAAPKTEAPAAPKTEAAAAPKTEAAAAPKDEAPAAPKTEAPTAPDGQAPRRKPSNGFRDLLDPKRPKVPADPNAAIQDKFQEEKGKFRSADPKTNIYAKVLQESEAWEDAAAEFERLAKEQDAIAEDWANRKYKTNSTVVTGNNANSAADEYETTIGAANERRRQAAVNNARKEAENLRGYADTLRKRVGALAAPKVEAPAAPKGQAPTESELAQERDKNIEKLRAALDSAREAYNRYRSGKAKEEALERVIALENQLAELTGENSNSRTAKQALKEGPLDENESYPEEDLTKDDVNRLLSKYEPEDLYEYVLCGLAGRRFIWEDHPHNGTRGLGSHLFGRNEPNERNKRISWRASRAKGGLYPEEVAERIYEDLPVSLAEQTDDSAILNIILDEIRVNHSPAGVLREVAALFREKEKVANNEFTREAWAAARNRIAVIKAEEAADNATDAAWLTGRELTDEEWAEYQELAESLYDEADDAWLNSHILSDEDYDALIQTDEKTNIFDRNNQDNNGNDTRGEGDTRGPGETPVHGSGETGPGMGEEGRQDAAEGSDGGSQEGQEGLSGNAGDAGMAVRGASVSAENGAENDGRLGGRESAGGGQAGRAESVTPTTPAAPEANTDEDSQKLLAAAAGNTGKQQDFGEKIGLARKDLAGSGFKRSKSSQSAPAWRKKYKTTNNNYGVSVSGRQGLDEDTDFSEPFYAYHEVKGKSGRVYYYAETDENNKPRVFHSEEEFEAYAPVAEAIRQGYRVSSGSDENGKHSIFRIASNGKRVIAAEFDTREEAQTYLASPEGASALLGGKAGGSFEIPYLEDVTRKGRPDYRGGRDVTGQDFIDTFGFRGGEFGNWMNAEERQTAMNLAYDAFMDMADLLGISPEALSLGGRLGIAFGARGGARETKGAVAHYEPKLIVINITKERGAGSLAHEWAHAVDNYFGNFGSFDVGKDNKEFLTENGVWVLSTARKEMVQAFRDVVSAMTERQATKEEAMALEQSEIDRERAQFDRNIKRYLEALKKGRTTYKYNRSTKQRDKVEYTLSEEQIKEFESLCEQLLADPTFKFEFQNGKFRLLGEIADKLHALTGNILTGTDSYEPLNNLGYYGIRLVSAGKRLEAIRQGESVKHKVATEYQRNSAWFDKGRVAPYYTQRKEMFARAFESWLAREMSKNGQSSDYLTYEKGSVYDSLYAHTPYPGFRDAPVIDQKMRELFDTIQEKEDESGQTILYQLAEGISGASSTDVADDGMTRFQLIGAKGARRLDYDDEKGTRMDNLAVARDMEAAGKDAPAIWFATGWQKGADGRWKYEIPDGKFKMPDLRERLHAYNANPARFGFDCFSWTLPEVYDNPELYKAYPSLKWTTVRIVGPNVMGDKTRGSYLMGANRITLNAFDLPQMAADWESGKVSGKDSEEAFREMSDVISESLESTIIHEIQHAVQEQEGFATGASPAEMQRLGRKALTNEEKALKGAIDKIRTVMRRKGTPSENILKQFAKVPVEQLTDEVMSEVRSALMKPIPFEEAVAVARKYFNLDDYASVALSQLTVIDSAYRDRLLPGIIQKQDADKLLRRFLSVMKSMSKSPMAAYRAVAGEVEARNAARRSKMSEEYRKGNPPSSTEDVARKDQIVMFQLSDKAYMDAVEKGDMETASAMVREAFLKAYPNTKIADEGGAPLVVYHGTDADFNTFDWTKGRTNMDIAGMFFSPWELDAKGYGPNVRAFYLNIENPASEGVAYEALRKYAGQNQAGLKARTDLQAMGYDGVNNGDEEYIAFNPNQIKSADPVTYDDNGNVIPLSERFSPSDDIRYQLTPNYLHKEDAKGLPKAVSEGGKIKPGDYFFVMDAISANPLRSLLRAESGAVTGYRDVVKDINLDNYYIGTNADFTDIASGASRQERAAKWEEMKDSGKYVWHKSPLSDSEYLLDGNTGDVYRYSDHWGKLASCIWTLDGYAAPILTIAKANIKDFTLNGNPGRERAVKPAVAAKYGEALMQTLVNYRALRDGDEYQFTPTAMEHLEQSLANLEALKADYDKGGIGAVADRPVRYQLTPKQAEEALTEISRSNTKAYDPEASTVRFQITKRTAESIDRLLAKNPNIDARGVAAFKTYVEHEETPAQLAMAKWFGKGSIRLPEDKPLVDEALKTCRKMKMDPMAYNGPGEIVKDWYERIRPEKEDNSKLLKPEAYPGVLTNKVDYGNGITVYNVADTREGQQAVRDLMNDHLTVDGHYYNCWCLEYCSGSGELTDSAIDYWGDYSACPKRVAFYNGRIIAFCASDRNSKAEWWDLSDQSHSRTIPVTMPIPGDAYARSSMMEFDESSEELMPTGEMSSGNKKNGLYREWDKKGALVLSENYKGGKRNGLVETWSEGRLDTRTEYRDGRQNGLYEEWYANGQIKTRAEYRDGDLNGLQEVWYENGQMKSRGEYKDWRINGVAEEWYENGQMKSRGEYRANIRNGIYEEWYENGQMKSRGEYEDGKNNGTLKRWYANGQLMEQSTIGANTPYGIREKWYEDGHLKSREEFSNRNLNGISEEWYENGRMKSREEYKDNKIDGISESWYANGQIKYRGEFKDGEQNGPLEEWYENGQLASRAEYKDGWKDGLYERWYENGQLDLREEYKGGEPRGLSERWYPNGVRKWYHEYRDGRAHGLYESWYKDTAREIVCVYENGEAERFVFFNEDGTIRKSTVSSEGVAELIAMADARDAEVDAKEAYIAEIEANEVRFSLRTEPAPKKTRIGYAAFVVLPSKSGGYELYPKMIQDPGPGAPVRVWLNADTGEVVRDKDGNMKLNTLGRVQVKSSSIFRDGTTGSGQLAWRPGKHLADYPNATQFELKTSPGEMQGNIVFFEVEYAVDKDYQTEAWEYGINKNGNYIHTQAGLPYIPKDGFYKYRTNADANIPAMIITGAYKINRALTDEEAKRISQTHGGRWLKREDGAVADEKRLREMGLADDQMDARRDAYDYSQMPGPVDIGSEIMTLEGYTPHKLNFKDKNLLAALRENNATALPEDRVSMDHYAEGYLSPEERGWNREDYTKGKETTRYQLAQNETVVQKQARDRYEQLLQAKLYKMTENHQDSMRALLELQRAVSEAYGRELEDYENAYIHENAMSSKNKYQSDEYRRNYVNPLEAAVKKLIREGETRQTVIDYMMARHGLERNAYMQGRVAAKVTDALATASSFDLYIAAAQARLAAAKTAKRTGEVETLARQIAGFQRDRAAAIKEASDLLKKHGIELDDVKAFTPGMLDGVDFAGLTQLTGDKEHFTELAGKMVEDFEKDHDTKDLWTQTNQATKKTLATLRDGGVLSQASYDAISKMYENYIPLRGWDDKVAHDVWEYVQDDTGRFGSVLKNAGGRKSKADDPIAVIAWMGQRGIQQANRNAMKQKLLNLALNMPTDLMTVSDTWIILDPDKGEWRTAVADAGGKETVAEFEARMQKLELQGLAKRVKGKLDVPYRILPMEERQHAVIIQQGDKSYTVYINSDPRAAEAINGLLNPDIHNSPLMQKVDSISGDINRFLASNFTQRNPEFVLRNLSRDLLFSNFSVFITEDAKYRRKFLANQGLAAAKLPGLLHRRNKGKLDRNNPMDRMYLEFLENGGETGYTNIITVEENKRRLERIEKDGNSRINNINDMLDVLASPVDNMNAWAESVCRFAAFLTSRESGRGIARSVWDAKDISVNFNKKGSAGDALSGWMRMTHLFYNAAVQGMAKFARMVGANPKRAVPAMMSLALGGFLIRFVNQWLSGFGGDGDPDDYYDLPETVRRNNICLAVGGTGKFITVPLSIEQRTFYGMGELLASWMAGKERYDNPGLELVGMLADLTPVNPEQFVRSLKGKDLGGKFAAYGATMGPDALRTAFQLMNNEDYFGIPIYQKNDFNENLPAYRKAYKSTGKTYVSLAKFLNDRTGGNEYRQGSVDLNPAVAEHVLESYFGGIYKFLEKGVNTVASAVSPEDEVQARKMPIVSSFLSDTKDSRVYGRTINNAYYQYKEKVDRFTTELNGFKKEMRTGKDIEAYARHLYELNGSPDAEAKMWMDQYAKQLDYIRKMGEAGLYTEEQVREESLKVKEDAVFKLESIYDNE